MFHFSIQNVKLEYAHKKLSRSYFQKKNNGISFQCTEKSIVFFQNAGEYKVTLVIFSGVSDPVWNLHREKLKIHLDRSAGRKTYGHEHLPHILGFRGFLLDHPETDHEELIVGKETKALQKVLLDTMPDGLIPNALRQKISNAIEKEVVSAHVQGAYHPSKSAGKTATEPIQHYAPELNLDRWNVSDLVRKNNNCYNYANDKITNSFAQPGSASGKPISTITKEEVLKSSGSDGLLKIDAPDDGSVPEAPAQPNCLVALVVAEGKKISSPQFYSNKLVIVLEIWERV